MKRLCPDCARELLYGPDGAIPKEAVEMILSGEVTVTLWPHKCSRFTDPTHPRQPRHVLEELPPNARS